MAMTDTTGTGGTVTYEDPVLDPRTPFTYRVTAFSARAGESAPSSEVAVDFRAAAPPSGAPARWLDVHLGRRRSVIVDGYRPRTDRVVVTGSYAVIDMDSSVPSVLNDADPRPDGIAIQVRAPGNLVLVSIPANDPRWRVVGKGIYQWKTRAGAHAPASTVRINTRKSQFTLTSDGNDFGSVPLNLITVALICQGASGSDTRTWIQPDSKPAGTRTLFKLPR